MSPSFESKKCKVAIFGAYGLFGSFLSKYLISKSYKVLKQGRKSYADFTFDPTDTFLVKNFLQETQPDFIVNLNAITDVDLCEKDPNLAFLGNVKTTEIIGNCLNENKTHLIQISTDQVYDGEGPHKENNVKPTNIYGLTKLESENKAKKVNATILRTNFLGRSYSLSKKSFTDWLVDAFRNNQNINLFSDIKFCAVHQSFLSYVIEKSFFFKPNEIINVGCSDSISKANLALKLANILGIDFNNYKLISSDDILRPAKRPKDMSLDTLKFRILFNEKSPSIEDTIKLIKRDYEKI